MCWTGLTVRKGLWFWIKIRMGLRVKAGMGAWIGFVVQEGLRFLIS